MPSPPIAASKRELPPQQAVQDPADSAFDMQPDSTTSLEESAVDDAFLQQIFGGIHVESAGNAWASCAEGAAIGCI